jgi:hypothetical protein
MGTNTYAIENGNLRANPAIVSDGNPFAAYALQAYRQVRPVKAMVLRVATEVLTDDAVVADCQSPRST